jgi:hypothetical protein
VCAPRPLRRPGAASRGRQSPRVAAAGTALAPLAASCRAADAIDYGQAWFLLAHARDFAAVRRLASHFSSLRTAPATMPTPSSGWASISQCSRIDTHRRAALGGAASAASRARRARVQ